MTFAISLTVAILFGTGSYLMLQRNLVRVVVGIVLISNAANLFIIASGLSVGSPPILPVPGTASDPLVQAMVLTAIVISSSITALLLALVYRLYRAHGSVDIEELSRAEIRAAESLEEESLARTLRREEEPGPEVERGDPGEEVPEEPAPHPGGNGERRG